MKILKVIIIGSLLGLSSCIVLKRAADKLYPFESSTNVVEVLQPITNYYSFVSNGVTNRKAIITVSTNSTTNIIWQVKSSTQDGLQAAKEATSFIPAPYNAVAEGGLTVLAGLLALLARAKTKKANKKSAILSAVISGVEKAGNSEVKASIATAAKAVQVFDDLHKIVKDETAR